MTVCGFFNKSKNEPCKNAATSITVQPVGHITDACKGHAGMFVMHLVHKNGIGCMGAGTGYNILPNAEKALKDNPYYEGERVSKNWIVCACGFATLSYNNAHYHSVGANHSEHFWVM